MYFEILKLLHDYFSGLVQDYTDFSTSALEITILHQAIYNLLKTPEVAAGLF